MQSRLENQRIGYLAHPATVNQSLEHGLDLLRDHTRLKITCAFGPQHGIRGEKQDNMIESDDFVDPRHGIPVFSLYGKSRRLTNEMADQFDVLIIDLQDAGCRIYTYLTTLIYMIEDCARLQKKIVVFDRPNPAGRPIEGNKLDMNYASFVGAAPVPMRHGLTLGEAGRWYIQQNKLDIAYEVIAMEDYHPAIGWQSSWPGQLSWVNPSPNVPRLSTLLIYPGSVLLEGTWLSEGRGTTRPLEVVSAPGFDGNRILAKMAQIQETWMNGCLLRPCAFEPTFQKHAGKLCQGFQIHVDYPKFSIDKFRPYRLIALTFKAIRTEYPDFELWRPPPYEYEEIKMPIDILSGSEFLRHWVDDNQARWEDLDNYLADSETQWMDESKKYLQY